MQWNIDFLLFKTCAALTVLEHRSKQQNAIESNNVDLPLAFAANNPLTPCILVKSTTTTYPVYLYVRAMENAAVSNGSIFASSGNLPYNVQGDGLGIFYGYGASYDTLICE